MRQRKAKDLDKRMEECGAFLVKEPAPYAWSNSRDRRTGDFNARDFYVEIGCGKGDFLLAKAMDNPDKNFLGIEGQETVLLRALEKAMWLSGRIVTARQPEKVGEADVGGSADTGENAGPDRAADVGGSADAGENAGPDRAADADESRISVVAPLTNLKFACTYVRTMDRLFEESSLAGIYLNFSDPWPKGKHRKRRLTWRGRLKDYQWALRKGGFIEFKTDNDPLFDFTLEEIAACGWEPAQLSRDLHHSDLEARLVMTEYEKKFHNAGKNINFVRIQF